MAAAGDFLQSLSFNKKRSPLMTLLSTMITAGLLEELCKFLFVCLKLLFHLGGVFGL